MLVNVGIKKDKLVYLSLWLVFLYTSISCRYWKARIYGYVYEMYIMKSYIYPAKAIKPLIILLLILRGLKKVSNIQGYVWYRVIC